MIVDSLYPTAVTYNSNQTETTSLINTIAEYSGSTQYFVGYTSLPQFCKLSNLTYDSNSFTFTPTASSDKKINFGYGAYHRNFSKWQYGLLYDYSNSRSDGEFFSNFNKLKVGTVRAEPIIYVSYLYRHGSSPESIDAVERPSYQAIKNADGTKTYIKSIIDFLHGDITLDVTFSTPYGSFSIDLDVNNFDNGYMPYTTTLGSTYLDGIIFFRKIELRVLSDVSTPFGTDGTSDYSTATPFFAIDDYYIKSGYYPMSTDDLIYSNEYYTEFNETPNVTHLLHFDDIYACGLDFTIDKSNPVLNGTQSIYINGNCVAIPYYHYANACYIYHLIKPIDLLRIVAMCPNLNGYTPIFKDGEPTGEFTDSIALLESWQVDDITDNTYTPQDNPDSDNPPDPDQDIPVQPPPTEGANITLQLSRRMSSATGFITMYNITSDQLRTFGNLLYKSMADFDPHDPAAAEAYLNFFLPLSETLTGTLDISAIVNFIISVRQYPFSVATLPDTSELGTSSIYLGSGKVGFPIGSAVRVLTSSISVLSAGSCKVVPGTPYNDFRDYFNATVTCFLPYCGTVELNPIEVINNTLHCYYAIDFYTGECTAFLMLDNGTHQYLCASKTGVIGVMIPITATNSGQVSARHIADNARDSSLVVSAISSLFSSVAGAASGNVASIGSAVTGLWDVANQQQLLQADRQGRSAVLAPSLSGGSGGASFMLPDSVYVQIRRGTYARPSNYGSTCAYPSTVSGRLGDFRGYTQCQNPDLSGVSATRTEKSMIADLLQTGVYL